MKRIALVFVLSIQASAFAQEPLPALLKKLDENNANARFDALLELGRLGSRAAPATDRLVTLLTKHDEQERVLAVIALGKIGKPAVGPVAKLLDHEDEMARHAAVWTLALIGPDAKPTAPRLVQLALADSDAEVRSKSAYALARIAADDAKVLHAIVPLLNDRLTPLPIRLALIEVLHCWGEPAIAPAGEALKNDATCEAAQKTLKDLLAKHKTKTAAEAMLPFVETAYLQSKPQRVLESGKQFRPAEPTPYISELCDSEEMNFVVKKLGPRLLAPIEKKLQSDHAETRRAAIKALGWMGCTLTAHVDKQHPPVAIITLEREITTVPPNEAPELIERIVKQLVPLLLGADRETRAVIAGTLPHTKTTDAVLKSLLLDEDDEVRRNAYFSLKFAGIDGARHLRERFESKNVEPRMRIAASLTALHYDQACADLLWKHLADPKADDRLRAAHRVTMLHIYSTIHQKDIVRLAVPILIEGLASAEPDKRVLASGALAKCGHLLQADHTRFLIAALRDKDAKVRFHAIAALRAHPNDKRSEVLPAVRPFLRDPDASTRVIAVLCFRNAGAAGLPDLVQMLTIEKDRAVRDEVLNSLAYQDVPASVNTLFKMADDPADWKRAMQSLMWMNEKKHFAGIREVLCKQDEAIRMTFRGVKPTDTAAASALAITPMLKSDDLAANRRAAYTLDKFTAILWSDSGVWGVPIEKAIHERLLKLRETLKSKDPAIRREVVALLGLIRSLQQHVKFHEESRPPNDAGVRKELRDYLAENQYRFDELMRTARRDDDLSVRRLARQVMLAPVSRTPWD